MDSSPPDRSTLNHAHLCPGILWQLVLQLSCTWVGGEERMPPRPSLTCSLGSLLGPPLPSYHETPQFRTLFLCPSHFSSPFRQLFPKTDPIYPWAEPGSRDSAPLPHTHTVSLGVPSSPATSPQASLLVQPALYMLRTVLIAPAK